MDKLIVTAEVLQDLIRRKEIVELRRIFDEYNGVDIAEIASSLTVQELLFIFKTYLLETRQKCLHILNTMLKKT